MNLWQRKNLVVFCLLGLALTMSAQAQRYSVWTPVGTPDITHPASGSGIGAGAALSLICRPLTDYDYDNYTCSAVEDGATITWTAKDAYGNDVGQFIDNLGTKATWIAPTVEGAVTIYATADDDPYYLANDPPQQHSHVVNVVKRVYVKPGAPGANSGASWYDAFAHLEDALARAGAGWEVWVAQGTYYPGASRSDSFGLPSGAAIYGGFYGNESSREQRAPSTYVTTLSGDIDEDGITDSQNCYTVVFGSSVSGATLDGFTITRGYNELTDGAGIRLMNCSGITIKACTISNNAAASAGTEYQDAGGAYLENSGTITFDGCTFSSNSAADDGGGAYVRGGSAAFDTCTFSSNTSGEDGGGISLDDDAELTFDGCGFTSNSALGSGTDETPDGDGGAMAWKNGSTGTVENCSFTGNHARNQGGAAFISAGDEAGEDGSSPSFTGCTFSSNSTTGDTDWDNHNHGGAVSISDSGTSAQFEDCEFLGNTSYEHGGAAHVKDGAGATFLSCLFKGNEADRHWTLDPGDSTWKWQGGDGGAVRIDDSSSLSLTHCTVVSNHADNRGGAVRRAAGSATIIDSILWGNAAPTAPEISGSVTVTYSDVEGGYPGAGNINADPDFLNTSDYQLDSDSPCRGTASGNDNMGWNQN